MTEIAEILERAHQRGWEFLPESDGFAILAALGLTIPATLEFEHPEDLAQEELATLAGERVVLKAVCPDLPHKTEAGAISILPREIDAIRAAARQMISDLSERSLQGFLLQQWIDYDHDVGSELMVSLRWDREFGPVLTCGPGGLQAEILGQDLKEDRGLCLVSPTFDRGRSLHSALAATTAVKLMTTCYRQRPARLPFETLVGTLRTLVKGAQPLLAAGIDEIEINPLVAHRERLIPLDVLVRSTTERTSPAAERPTAKLRFLLEPRSIAIVGVSRQLNPGRIILQNLLRRGFDPERVFVVKPGEDRIEGCRCVPDLEALPERVDLLIVAVAAAQVPELLDEVIDGRCAESIILIPGGLEERPGSHHGVRRVLESLHRARGSDWRGPLVNGGNCMGIRSAPGGYDTFFLPEYKMPPAGGADAVAALVAQSGAFLIARASKVRAIAFKYSISIGNQLDLTLGDYLLYLARDQDLQVIAVYVEGFKSLDGLRFLAAAEQIREQGRTVVLYRAGRGDAGARAAASHTASLAGSYDTTVALARAAGVLVADSIADFEDLLELAVLLRDRPLVGRQLAGLSNAGFECVTLSDHLSWFVVAGLTRDTVTALRELFVRGGVEGLVEVQNPLDLTPMMGDELYAQVTEVMLADPNVDVGVVGCVPLTGALETLPAGPSHDEDLYAAGAIATRLADLWEKTTLPWVTVVEGGSQYDALAARLREAGIPTFRTMDRAMEILEKYGRWMANGLAVGEAGEGQG